MTDQCEKPKTKLELILGFFREVVRSLDRHRITGFVFWVIIAAGISITLTAYSLGYNADNIIKLFNLFR